MQTKTYLPFIEENDNEGEVWVFYIPVPGNEKALDKLKEILSGSDTYSFGRDMATEEEVDAVVKLGNRQESYMPFHNKLDGTLDIKALEKALDENDDVLYKGGITDYLHGTEEGAEAVRDPEEDDGGFSEGSDEDGE